MQNHSRFYFLLLLLPSAAFVYQFHVSHTVPIAPIILGFTGILFVALVGKVLTGYGASNIRNRMASASA